MLITRYLGTSFYIFGLISVILNMYVFSHSSLRSNPCCLFLLALNIVDFLHIHNSLLVRIAQHGFHWDPIVLFPFACRIRYYIGYVLITLYMIFIILASCERYGSTCNRHSHWRSYSNARTVRYIIFICTFICCLVCSFSFSCYEVNDDSLCAIRKGVCTMSTMVYTFIVIGLVPPSFTAVFAWLTCRHLRNLHRRSQAAPVSYKTYLRIKQANEQFTSMLLMQIAAMLASGTPYALLMIYQLSTLRTIKTSLWIAWEHLIGHCIHLLTYITYVSSAYIYLAVSPMYRECLVSTAKKFRTRFKLDIEFNMSALLSLSRAEKTLAISSVHAANSEPTEQQQQHRPRIVLLRVLMSQKEPPDIHDTVFNTSKADAV